MGSSHQVIVKGMKKNIWLMEGLSSQRDIILGIKSFSKKNQTDIAIFASHRHERNEILSVADRALIEPQDAEDRLAFILSTVSQWGIDAIHTGRNCDWFEAHRAQIEASGASLTTGSSDPEHFALADDKVSFAELMAKNGLPVVPSVRINDIETLQARIENSPFASEPLCVKPVTGIYGMGFWRFDDSVSPMAVFNHPEQRRVHPQHYLTALTGAETFAPLVLMPWLPGPEYSVDILAENGKVLAAVGRRKEGALQYLVNEGEAFRLACACAELMQADGLVNVQTRNDSSGKPLLLEINMRPSGGIGYTLHSGVNLPGMFAARRLGLLQAEEVTAMAKRDFKPAIVRSITDVINYSPTLTNRLN